MRIGTPLIHGKLIKRYKRFLVDVELADRQKVTAHCPNSGSMEGLLRSRSPIVLSRSTNPRRKYPLTWEFIRVKKAWVCINTALPNRLVDEALRLMQIPELAEYSEIKREVLWRPGCRFDFLLSQGNQKCFVEVKNVTLADADLALFPDAVTERGVKHLHHLMQVVRQGHRAVMLFLVNREDCVHFRPAKNIDPVYAQTLAEASEKGVEILVYRARIEPPEILLDCRLNFDVQ